MAEVMTSGIGSVVSPIPRLITLASGFLAMCAFLRLAIYKDPKNHFKIQFVHLETKQSSKYQEFLNL